MPNGFEDVWTNYVVMSLPSAKFLILALAVTMIFHMRAVIPNDTIEVHFGHLHCLRPVKQSMQRRVVKPPIQRKIRHYPNKG